MRQCMSRRDADWLAPWTLACHVVNRVRIILIFPILTVLLSSSFHIGTLDNTESSLHSSTPGCVFNFVTALTPSLRGGDVTSPFYEYQVMPKRQLIPDGKFNFWFPDHIRKISTTNRRNTPSHTGPEGGDDGCLTYNPNQVFDVKNAAFTLVKRAPRRSMWSGLGRAMIPWRYRQTRKQTDGVKVPETCNRYLFNYNYNELQLPPSLTEPSPSTSATTADTTAVLLIQPIGVGIGRWFYDRLLQALSNNRFRQNQDTDRRLIFLVPDLLGCGTACDSNVTTLPLIDVKDWSDQLVDLMVKFESNSNNFTAEREDRSNIRWCIVSNGGCAPIALEIAKRYVEHRRRWNDNKENTRKRSLPEEKDNGDHNDGERFFHGQLTNLILSAPPRLSFLLRPSDPKKARRSYKTLCGVAGKLFWWYALRKDGAFVQSFSEKNLVSRRENLGGGWTPKCLETARAFNGQSRYSTFAFLAGSLQVGCRDCFDAFRGSSMQVDVITGGDKRRNPARSWFWDKSGANRETDQSVSVSAISDDAASSDMRKYREKKDRLESREEGMTLPEFLSRNGNGGREIIVGGRRCPAHEDADGFAGALLELIGYS